MQVRCVIRRCFVQLQSSRDVTLQVYYEYKNFQNYDFPPTRTCQQRTLAYKVGSHENNSKTDQITVDTSEKLLELHLKMVKTINTKPTKCRSN